jgi:hypothetical protein
LLVVVVAGAAGVGLIEIADAGELGLQADDVLDPAVAAWKVLPALPRGSWPSRAGVDGADAEVVQALFVADPWQPGGEGRRPHRVW